MIIIQGSVPHTYAKCKLTNSSRYRRPSRGRGAIGGSRGCCTACGALSSSSMPSSAGSSISSGAGTRMFLSLQMLCSMAQTLIIWQTFTVGVTLISPCKTWNRRFSWPIPRSTTFRVFLCALQFRRQYDYYFILQWLLYIRYLKWSVDCTLC